MEHRADILAAIYTMARAWILAGRPEAETPVMGSFEQWTSVLGGVLAFARFSDFLANVDAMYEQADDDTPQWEAFLDEWSEIFEDRPTTVAQVLGELESNTEFAALLPDTAGTAGAKNLNRKLAKALSKRADMRFPNGLHIIRGRAVKRAIGWVVTRGQPG